MTHPPPSHLCLFTYFLVVNSEKESDFLQHLPYLCLQEEPAVIIVDTTYSSCSCKVAAMLGLQKPATVLGARMDK